MEQSVFEVLGQKRLTRDVYELKLAGPTGAITRPGQFVMCRLPGFSLRRPISVCSWDEAGLTLVYKVVGQGTRAMTQLAPGEKLDLLTGLGNGYDLSLSGPRPLLIGGGAGVPPLYGLCRALRDQGKTPGVILGFHTRDEVFYEEAFRALGAEVAVTTADGSYGTPGFVTDAMGQFAATCFYACGPMPMFRAIEKQAKIPGQYSLEARMGCGFGACMGCTIETKDGPRRVCKEGPVFRREELLWES